ncbi:hypothetical protein [Armatimonas rosea]|uniref:Tetratricopeptide repeat protein n=1 Tax=Armatimonas rosea TaxID=685828 RepID=A0A7W9W9G1_ARMRO|nr:hypothetical protein [Armatimonas rosea]MBB6053808.1 hypothetical protein [Armatimonas rosea]
MKKVDASRPGLGLPARLGILTMVLTGGVFVTLNVMAKQNGADMSAYLTTLDFGKAYSKENLNYLAAEAKLKLGDRKGCAALVKTLSFRKEDDNVSHQELRAALVKAQLAAGEFSDARASAQDDRSLLVDVFRTQTEKEGLDATLANAASVPEPDRSAVFGSLITNLLGYGSMTTVSGKTELERLALSERLIAQMTPEACQAVYQTLMSAYYKAGNLPAALATAERIQPSEQQAQALNSLGSSCLQANDTPGLKAVLQRLPNAPSQRKEQVLGTNQRITSITPSMRYQLLQTVGFRLPPASALELVRTYAHPQDRPELLRSVCSQARSKKDLPTLKAALAVLRPDTSEAGKRVYDQEVEQFFYSSALSQLSEDPLALAQTIHSDAQRGQALLSVGRHYVEQKNWEGVDKVLALLRGLSSNEARLQYDSLVSAALFPLRQSDPERAKRLEKQAMTPEMRRQYQLLLSPPRVSGSTSYFGMGRVMIPPPTVIRR